jgi:hypothetical protein
MSVYSKLVDARKTFSRAVIADVCGVSIAVVDRALKTKEVTNEDLSKGLGGMTVGALEKAKTKITDLRGNHGSGKPKAKAFKKAKKAAPRKRAAKPAAETHAAA